VESGGHLGERGVPVADEAVEAEALPGHGARVRPEATRLAGVGQQGAHPLDQLVRPAGGVAGLAVGDRRRHLGRRQGDHRHADRHRLDHRQRQAGVAHRAEEEAIAGDPAVQVAVGDVAEPVQPLVLHAGEVER
jgi:hypothetical protein